MRGTLGRSTDDADDWVLVTEWENVGSYRRALGNYEVKLHATPLLGEALDLPELVRVAARGRRRTATPPLHASDHSMTAPTAAPARG